MAKSKLENFARDLIILKSITSTTGTVSDRAKRKYEKVGVDSSELLKEKRCLPEDSQFSLDLKWSDQAPSWARKLTLALEEFKQVNLEAYQQFEEIRKKHKKVRRAYLEFGLIKGDLPEEDYLDAIKGLIKGLNDNEVRNVYDSIRILDESLKKKKKFTETLLLPE
ncbi:MAG: hypothetical protein KKF67_01265 [Nanoarchaeota archaeon]|nr:hypothetical protein [Nanoarchaeota archaeon]